MNFVAAWEFRCCDANYVPVAVLIAAVPDRKAACNLGGFGMSRGRSVIYGNAASLPSCNRSVAAALRRPILTMLQLGQGVSTGGMQELREMREAFYVKVTLHGETPPASAQKTSPRFSLETNGAEKIWKSLLLGVGSVLVTFEERFVRLC